MAEWIPTSERLPNEMEDVLISVTFYDSYEKAHNFVSYAFCVKNEKTNKLCWYMENDMFGVDYTVDAWMPYRNRIRKARNKMVRIYVKDNETGYVHEHGTSPHDSLELGDDGSLHYVNIQNCTGTRYPEEGYSFCDKNGNTDFDCPETGDRIYNIGGCYWERKRTMKVKLDEGAIMPTRAHKADAGYDLYSPVDMFIRAKGYEVIDTGVHIQIPEGYVGFLKSKSGLNMKFGIVSEGVIDSGYTGSVKVKLYNHSFRQFKVHKGHKITQIVFLPIYTPDLEVVDSLDDTERGENGFGSSGK